METGTTVDAVRIEAMPFLADTHDSPWELAQTLRDNWAEQIRQALGEHGVDALVEVSQPGEFPPSVGLTAWICESDLSDSRVMRRQSFSVSIDVNAYLDVPLIKTVTAHVNGKEYSVTTWDVDDADILGLTNWVLGEDDKPAVMRMKLFQNQNEIIAAAKPPFMTLERGLVIAGLALALFSFGTFAPLFLIGLGMVGFAMWRITKRRQLDSVVKRPPFSPRRLFLIDSWHACVPDVGTRYEELRDRIEQRLSAFDQTIQQKWERYSSRTPYSIEWRQRLTLTKGQATVHVHMHPVADQVFVGWDGYLNWARWEETGVVSSVAKDGEVTNFRNIGVGPYIPSNFDLVEFNVLSEMVHGQIVAELKRFMKEREIDAEIDFTIIRGDRDNALTAGEKSKGSSRRRSLRKADAE